MGLFDSLGKAASSVAAGASSFNTEVQSYVDEYQNESDDFLKRKLQGGSVAQKAAAAKVLKSKGYGS